MRKGILFFIFISTLFVSKPLFEKGLGLYLQWKIKDIYNVDFTYKSLLINGTNIHIEKLYCVNKGIEVFVDSAKIHFHFDLFNLKINPTLDLEYPEIYLKEPLASLVAEAETKKSLPINVTEGKLFVGPVKSALRFSYDGLESTFKSFLKEGVLLAELSEDRALFSFENLDLFSLSPFLRFFSFIDKDLELEGIADGSFVLPYSNEKLFCDLHIRNFSYKQKKENLKMQSDDLSLKMRGVYSADKSLLENLNHLNTFWSLTEGSFSSDISEYEINSINGFFFLDSFKKFQCEFSAKAQNQQQVIPLLLNGKKGEKVKLRLDFLQTRESNAAVIAFAHHNSSFLFDINDIDAEKKKIIDLFLVKIFPQSCFEMNKGFFHTRFELLFSKEKLEKVHLHYFNAEDLSFVKNGFIASLKKADISLVYDAPEDLISKAKIVLENGAFEKDGYEIQSLDTSIEIVNKAFNDSKLTCSLNQMSASVSFDGLLPFFSTEILLKGNLCSFFSKENEYIGTSKLNLCKKKEGVFVLGSVENKTDETTFFVKTKENFFSLEGFWKNLEFLECDIKNVCLEKLPFLFQDTKVVGDLSGNIIWENDHFRIKTHLDRLFLENDSFKLHFNEKVTFTHGSYSPIEGKLSFCFPFQNGSFTLFNKDLHFKDIQGDLFFSDQLFTFQIDKAHIENITFSAKTYFDPRGKVDVEAFGIKSKLTAVLNLMEKLDIPFSGSSLFEGDVFSDCLVYSYVYKDEPLLFFSVDGYFSDIEGKVFDRIETKDLKGSFSYDTNSENFRLYDATAFLSVEDEEKVLISLNTFEKNNEDVFFDLNLEQSFIELASFKGGGKYNEGLSFSLDKSSHLFGQQFSSCSCCFKENSIKNLEIEICQKFSKTKARLFQHLFGYKTMIPLEANFAIVAKISDEKGTINLRAEDITFLDQSYNQLELEIETEKNNWQIKNGFIDQWCIRAGLNGDDLFLDLCKENIFGVVLKSKMKDFEKLSIHSLKVCLPNEDGLFSLKGSLFMDFFKDEPFSLDGDLELVGRGKCRGFTFENETPLNIHFSVKDQLLIGGVKCLLYDDQKEHPIHFDPKVLHLDFMDKRLIATKSSLSIPKEYHFGKREFGIDLGQIDLLLDVDATLDELNLFIDKGSLLETIRVKHVNAIIAEKNASFKGKYLLDGLKIPFEAEVLLKPEVEGSITLFDNKKSSLDPLTIYWRYDKGIFIDHLSGCFSGVDAEFCRKEGGILVGKAKIDFAKLSPFLSPSLKEILIDELEMKEGYSLSGTFCYDPQDFSPTSFFGFLTGKDFSFFGYRLKTLFSEITWAPEKLHIDHLKISDKGGMVRVDQLYCDTEKEKSTLSIPQILFEDIRPSLLKELGSKDKKIDPLLIKTLLIKDITGDLDDSSTITGNGTMNFINSFSRGVKRTLFDLPSEVMGKIFGLDLELLIPVRGTLDFILQDKKFLFTDLKETFSENNRSQFFLFDKAEAYMDFDTNLFVNISMKQFVLFKFTEQMILSITGDLYNPKIGMENRNNFND